MYAITIICCHNNCVCNKINKLKLYPHRSVVYLLSYFCVFLFILGPNNCSVIENVLLIVLKYILKVLGIYLSTFSQN